MNKQSLNLQPTPAGTEPELLRLEYMFEPLQLTWRQKADGFVSRRLRYLRKHRDDVQLDR